MKKELRKDVTRGRQRGIMSWKKGENEGQRTEKEMDIIIRRGEKGEKSEE